MRILYHKKFAPAFSPAGGNQHESFDHTMVTKVTIVLARTADGGYSTEEKLWQEVNEAIENGDVDKLIKRRCAEFNIAKAQGDNELSYTLATMIDFMGRCSKYVD